MAGSCSDLIFAPTGGMYGVGHLERLAKIAIESLGKIAGQFEMLLLVLADRDEIGLVEQNVRGHQHRISK